MSDTIAIVAAKRTAIGSFLGTLSNEPAHKLGTTVIKALLKETYVNDQDICDVLL